MTYSPGDLLWTRLEPIAKNPSMDEGLRAPIDDPLWMLSRQWQLGEFEGEDGGSAVDIEVDVAHDHLTRTRLGGGNDDATPTDYPGGPLEAIVERETVLTEDERLDARLAAQAGAQCRRLLASHAAGADTHYTAAGFPEGYLLSTVSEDPDEPVDTTDLRFEDAVADDELDGHRVFRAVGAAIDQGAWARDAVTFPWGSSDPAAFPVPDTVSPEDGGTTIPGWAEQALREFHEWYGELYEEPESADESAWDPQRMEYRFGVSTGGPGGDPDGDGDTETVLAAGDYRGGRLDWYSFGLADTPEASGGDSSKTAAGQPDAARSLVGHRGRQPDSLFPDDPDDDPERTETDTKHVMPTRASFAGMPDPRYWAFEDANVDLDEIGADDVTDQVLVNFAMVFGNDWYTFPLRSPLGSLSRIRELTITDTFGDETDAEPTAEIAEDWNMFSLPDLGDLEGPGLFLPPVLDDTVESDPVEDVSMIRDEMANLGFAVETAVESPGGTTVERDEYTRPQLVVEEIAPNPDVDEEYVDLHNPGARPLDVGGWIVTDATETFTFPADATVPPDTTVTLYTGTEPTGETPPDHTYYWGAPAGPPSAPDPVWYGSSATVLSVYDSGATTSGVTANKRTNRPLDHLELRERVPGDGDDQPSANYRLATDIPDYWFALQPERTGSRSPLDPAVENYLRLSLVLDADTLDAESYEEIPDPEGEILDPYTNTDLYVYDEELLGGGKRLTRTYQAATWTDGTSYVWSGREARPGAEDVGSSTLQFDVLEGWAEDEES